MTPHQYQYWDSSVFVAYFNDEPQRAEVVEELLVEAQAGRITIVISSFVFVEVLRLKNRKRLTVDDEAMLKDFFEYPLIKPVDATRRICESERHVIWKHFALMPKDAVHLASALEYASKAHLDVLFSYDQDFLKLNGVVSNRFPITEPFLQDPTLWSTPSKPAS